MRGLVAILLLAGAAQAEDFAFKPFMTKYCTDCHGAKKQKADRRFDDLVLPITDGSGTLLAVLDIDSDLPAAFNQVDEENIQQLNRYFSQAR